MATSAPSFASRRACCCRACESGTLLLQVAASCLAAAVFYALTGYRAPLLIIGSAAVIFGLAVLTAWSTHGRRIVSFPDLLSACMYPLWKIPMYLQFVFSRQSEWVRSKRDKER